MGWMHAGKRKKSEMMTNVVDVDIPWGFQQVIPWLKNGRGN